MSAPLPGNVSANGWWVWNGVAWEAAVSRDAYWRWDGVQWRPALPPRVPRRRWQQRWSMKRRVALALCAVALVAAAAGVTAIAATRPDDRGLALALAISIPPVWSSCVGGLVVPRGQWLDVLAAIAIGVVALLFALFLIYVIGLVASGCDMPGTQAQTATCTDDNGASVGMLFAGGVGVVLWSAMLPFGIAAAWFGRRRGGGRSALRRASAAATGLDER